MPASPEVLLGNCVAAVLHDFVFQCPDQSVAAPILAMNPVGRLLLGALLMLHLSTSALVTVDAPAVGAKVAPHVLAALDLLSDAATILKIPIIAARYAGAQAPGLLAGRRPAKEATPELNFDPVAAVWQHSDLGQSIVNTNRSQLVVGGLWLEEAITLLSLKSLSIGIDTYVSVDAVAAVNHKHAAATQARLTQAGVVPTTSEQVLREWAALGGDGNVQSDIAALLQKHATSSS